MTSLEHNWGKTARNADFLSLPHPRRASRSNRTCVGRHISAGISAPLEKSGAKFHSQALSLPLSLCGHRLQFWRRRGHHTMALSRSLAPFIHLVARCRTLSRGRAISNGLSIADRPFISVRHPDDYRGTRASGACAERSLSLSLSLSLGAPSRRAFRFANGRAA